MVYGFVAGLVLAQGGASLAWKPVVGDKATYAVTMSGETAEGAFSAEGEVLQTVLRVEKDAVVVKRETKGALLRTGGSEIRDSRATTTEVKLGRDGWVLEVKDSRDESSSLRLLRAISFVAPASAVGEGSTWKVSYVAKGAVPASDLSCRVVSISGGVVKVGFTFEEKGVARAWKGTGEWSVEASTGAVVSTEARIVNWLDDSGKAGVYRSKRM